MRRLCYVLVLFSVFAPAQAAPDSERCYTGKFEVVGDNVPELRTYAQRLPQAQAYIREVETAYEMGSELVLEFVRSGGNADVRSQVVKFKALQEKGEKLFPLWTPYFGCGQLGFAAGEYFRGYLAAANGQGKRQMEDGHRLWNSTSTNCDAELDYGPPERSLKLRAPGAIGKVPFRGCTMSIDEADSALKVWTCPISSLPGCAGHSLSAGAAKAKARWLHDRVTGKPQTGALMAERIDLPMYNRYIEGQLKRAIKIAPIDEPEFKPYLVCVKAAKSLYQFAAIRRAENGQSEKSEKYRQPYWQQIGQCKEILGS